MSNVIKMKPNNKTKLVQCNLQQYPQGRMECPVTNKRVCYFIPLQDIDDSGMNPARTMTHQPAVNEILESLINHPDGQVEPVCLEWDAATAKFDIVFGYHRVWAMKEAYSKGLGIANHLPDNAPGVWAWIFTGGAAAKTKIQMRENGNKNPGTPATLVDMSDQLEKYINLGGLDIGYNTRWSSLSDRQKYDRAREYMKENTPHWGGRKFKGIWNRISKNGNSSVALKFKSYSKKDLAEYFCKHNPYGIMWKDLKSDLSGTVVTINGVKYGVYFVTSKSEINGALPTNASKRMSREKVDHMIVVSCLNNSTVSLLGANRISMETSAKEWNNDIYRAFDEVFWRAQTKAELASSADWARRTTL